MVSVQVRSDLFITQPAVRRPVLRQQGVSLSISPLVHLDHTVDLIYKPEAGEEANCTCEEEEDEDHNHSVSKVEDGAGSSNYLQL